MNTILVALLLAFIVFSVWNIINLRKLLKTPLKKDSELNDKKYWELKYKQEYMIAVFAVILGVITWLGYRSVEDIKQDIRLELASKLDSTKKAIDSIEERQNFVGDTTRYDRPGLPRFIQCGWQAIYRGHYGLRRGEPGKHAQRDPHRGTSSGQRPAALCLRAARRQIRPSRFS